MSIRLKLRRGTEAQNIAFIGSVGEMSVDNENWKLRVHDGSTKGGHLISDVPTRKIDVNASNVESIKIEPNNVYAVESGTDLSKFTIPYIKDDNEIRIYVNGLLSDINVSDKYIFLGNYTFDSFTESSYYRIGIFDGVVSISEIIDERTVTGDFKYTSIGEASVKFSYADGNVSSMDYKISGSDPLGITFGINEYADAVYIEFDAYSGPWLDYKNIYENRLENLNFEVYCWNADQDISKGYLLYTPTNNSALISSFYLNRVEIGDSGLPSYFYKTVIDDDNGEEWWKDVIRPSGAEVAEDWGYGLDDFGNTFVHDTPIKYKMMVVFKNSTFKRKYINETIVPWNGFDFVKGSFKVKGTGTLSTLSVPPSVYSDMVSPTTVFTGMYGDNWIKSVSPEDIPYIGITDLTPFFNDANNVGRILFEIKNSNNKTVAYHYATLSELKPEETFYGEYHGCVALFEYFGNYFDDDRFSDDSLLDFTLGGFNGTEEYTYTITLIDATVNKEYLKDNDLITLEPVYHCEVELVDGDRSGCSIGDNVFVLDGFYGNYIVKWYNYFAICDLPKNGTSYSILLENANTYLEVYSAVGVEGEIENGLSIDNGYSPRGEIVDDVYIKYGTGV